GAGPGGGGRPPPPRAPPTTRGAPTAPGSRPRSSVRWRVSGLLRRRPRRATVSRAPISSPPSGGSTPTHPAPGAGGGRGGGPAVSLAGARAGAHLGAAGLDVAWRAGVPHAHRAVTLAASVAARVAALEEASGPPVSFAGDAGPA